MNNDYERFTINHSTVNLIPNTTIHTITIKGTYSWLKNQLRKDVELNN